MKDENYFKIAWHKHNATFLWWDSLWYNAEPGMVMDHLPPSQTTHLTRLRWFCHLCSAMRIVILTHPMGYVPITLIFFYEGIHSDSWTANSRLWQNSLASLTLTSDSFTIYPYSFQYCLTGIFFKIFLWYFFLSMGMVCKVWLLNLPASSIKSCPILGRRLMAALRKWKADAYWAILRCTRPRLYRIFQSNGDR